MTELPGHPAKIELIVLPGLDGTATLLAQFCAQMGACGVAARAIEYSAHEPMGYAALEAYIRTRLPADGPFVLLGESFSGPLAIRLGASPPRGLRGLVLSTTFARAPVAALGLLAPWVRWAPARPPMPLLAWYLLGRWATPHWRDGLRRALRSIEPVVLRKRVAAAMRVDVQQELARIKLPCLLLRAKADRLLARAATSTVVDGIAGCRLVEVEGPHLLLQTAAEACANEVAHFIASIEPADGGASS